MAITYPLALPSTFPVRRVTLRARPAVGKSVSDFTFEVQIVEYQGQRWEAEIDLAPMARATAEEVVAWLLRLNGQAGTFLMGDPAAATPRGAAAQNPGTPLVAGAGQTGQNLNIDGAPASVTGWLLAGDYVQLGSGSTARLYKILDDVSTDATGAATLTLWPKIHAAASPADNDPLTVSNAVGRWRLASNAMEWSVDEATHYGLVIAAIGEV